MKCNTLWILTWMILIILCGYSWARIQCMDMDGGYVDWFIGYKLPKKADPQTSGADFLYMDAKNPTFRWSPSSLDGAHQAMGYTLQQIYDNAANPVQGFGYSMYNDQPPTSSVKAPSDKGHTKGVFALDSTTGFWLVHSIPNFTNPREYVWPNNARSYGQTFLCVSLSYRQFEQVGQQLMYNCPYIYKSHMAAFKKDLPSLHQAVDGVCQDFSNKTARLQTLGGQEVISFAKPVSFNADLYSAWVAPYFGSDVYTETWRRTNPLPSSCNTEYKVFNIKNVTLQESIQFKASQDHSKWAVTDTSPWTCIGDINRAESQIRRAGGTVCIKHYAVHKAFKSAIADWDTCPRYGL